MIAQNSPSTGLLHRFSQLVVTITLVLVFLGGMVTTKGAGLAVPDWPLSYGSLNPPGWWHIENVRLEHGHRLLASLVGFLTTVLAIWVYRSDSRSSIRKLGVAAFLLVALQGLFGGLRVTQMSVALAVVHACTAQVFLCVLIVLASALSPSGRRAQDRLSRGMGASLPRLSYVLVAVIFLQLVLGATMRHLGAGLAIPDFPQSFGGVFPPLDSMPVAIHFAHRCGAVLVLVITALLAVETLRYRAVPSWVTRPVAGLVVLVLLQVVLGAFVIWHVRPPVLTTLHVLNGAALLGTSVLVAGRLWSARPAASASPALCRAALSPLAS